MYDRLFARERARHVFVMQKVLAQMVAKTRDSPAAGTVINLASQAGRRGEGPGLALLRHQGGGRKLHAIRSPRDGPYGIRVNAIAPGVIDTPMWQQVDALFARYEGLQPGRRKLR